MNKVLIALGTGLLALQASAADFAVTISRKWITNECTSGYLSVDGKAKMYALELPWQGNKPEISSIPVGTYQGTLRYDHADHWRIELAGVPNRTNVQIHVGNNPADSKGCILVGQQIDTKTLCQIKAGTSKPAYAELRRAFYGTDSPTSTPDKKITVTIEQ